MWGFQGRQYWGRRERGDEVEGIVVVFAWMSSQEKHLKSYIDLYSSLGWNSLICHPPLFNLSFPEKAASLASNILIELVKELKIRPCPVVFASFSGGPIACMYKLLQIIEGKYDLYVNQDKYQLVGDCLSGYIFDSCPVDFTSDMGARFLLHPSVLKMSWRPPLSSWIATGIWSCVDALFFTRMEAQRADYWQTLYSSVSMGAPYLIFCSEDDSLASYQIICNFAQRLESLGGDVKMVKWSSSAHVAHYRHHPVDYKAAVSKLLGKATTIYSARISEVKEEEEGLDGTEDEVSEPPCYLKSSSSLERSSFSSTPRSSHFNPIKFNRGSRL